MAFLAAGFLLMAFLAAGFLLMAFLAAGFLLMAFYFFCTINIPKLKFGRGDSTLFSHQ